MLMPADDLAQTTPNTVPDYGSANALRRHEARAEALRCICLQDAEHQQGTALGESLLPNAEKLRSSCESPRLRKIQASRFRVPAHGYASAVLTRGRLGCRFDMHRVYSKSLPTEPCGKTSLNS